LLTCGRLLIGLCFGRTAALWGSQSWLQPAFSGPTRPGRDAMNQ
jgi:hypothetical protein